MTREEAKYNILENLYIPSKKWAESYNIVEYTVDSIYDSFEEAMKPKTCDGCKTCEHYSSGKQSDNFGWEKCGWDWECKRKYEDRYEPKDNS